MIDRFSNNKIEFDFNKLESSSILLESNYRLIESFMIFQSVAVLTIIFRFQVMPNYIFHNYYFSTNVES
jgi:hypothetical protein